MDDNEKKNASITQIIMELIEIKKPQNMQQLINLIKERNPAPESEIIQHIIRLHNQRKISLKEPPTQISHSFGTYLRTKEAYWYWTTLTLAASAGIAALVIQESVYPIAYVRNVLGLIFVMYLPGYSFIKALFPKTLPIKTSSENLDSIERIALSFGLSFALVPITGLILYYTPLGIRLAPIILSLLALTAVFATMGILRGYRFHVQQAFEKLS